MILFWLKRNWEIPATAIVIALVLLFCGIMLDRAESKGEARANATWELKALKDDLAHSKAVAKLIKDNADIANTYAQAIISREREWVTVTRKLRNEISKPVYSECRITDDARLLHDAAVSGDSDATEAEDSSGTMPAPNTPTGQ